MDEIIINAISVTITAVVIPLITYLGAKLSTYLKAKTDNEIFNKYIDNATVAVTMAVAETMQTYVDEIKKAGKFDAEAQKTAYAKSYEKAQALITADAKNAIQTVYGDFGTWLNSQIEYQVKNTK